MVGAVIFDMDGVIVDTEETYLQWLTKYLEEQGYPVPREKLCEIIGASVKRSQAFLDKMCSGNGEKLWNGYIEACDTYPFSYRELVISGIPELLQYLKRENVPVALASSSTMADIREMLNVAGLEEYFQVVTSGEMYKESKPNPEIYLHTAQLLGQDPTDCIVIEDSDFGIRAGKAAGAFVIAREEKRFGFSQQEADIIARDINQIRKIIEEMRRGER